MDEFMPDQKGNPTKMSTMVWVFKNFEGFDAVLMRNQSK
jgi:hypothetical protein